MAGFFGLFDYTKPGKGVDVDAPPKKAFFRFWELYWRKFARFIVLNMVAFAFLLPLITLLFLLYLGWLDRSGALTGLFYEAEAAEGGVVVFGMLQDMMITAARALPPPVSFLLIAASAVFYGPVMCGMTYVLRNFSREEHAWISDFFARMKSNFRQGAALGILEILALSTLFFNITAQPSGDAASWMNASLPFVRYVSVFLIIIIMFARQYMYAMAVTFNLRLAGILKNSFAFAFVGLFRNAGVALCQTALIFIMLVVPFADAILLPFFFISFTGFLTMFACFPLIHKHMIIPMRKREAGETDDDSDDINSEEPA